MAKGASQDKRDDLADRIQERLDTTAEGKTLRPRTCKQARLGFDLEYLSPVDVMTFDELAGAIEPDAMLAVIRDHLNILLRRRLPKTINREDANAKLSNVLDVITTLRAYRYNARSGEVSQATKDKRLGEATRKLMTQLGVDNEDELVAILKERMADSNA